MFKDKDLYCYCMDMVTLIMICADAYETIVEGMATAVLAHKAEYNSLKEACILPSYGLTHPKNLLKKQDKQKHVATRDGGTGPHLGLCYLLSTGISTTLPKIQS